eukprot:773737_1
MAARGCCERNANRVGICCFMNEDAFKHKPLAEVVQNNDRQCTDIPCCIGLLAVFVSQFILIGYAMGEGAKPELLLRGYDYNGNICKPGSSHGAYTAWPALKHTIKPSASKLMICVDSCIDTTPNGNSSLMVGGDYYKSISFLGSWCVPKYPQNFSSYSSFASGSEEYDRAVADVM